MNPPPLPWYREPWPWILMAGPFIVVIAGITTAWLAIVSNDGLVTEDYYRKGLAVGQTLASSERARALGLTAGMTLTSESATLRLAARAGADFVPPASVRVTLSHPTRAGLDQVAVLARDGQHYVGRLHVPASGHWLLLIEDDEAKSWRLMGSVVLPLSGEIVVGVPGEESARASGYR